MACRVTALLPFALLAFMAPAEAGCPAARGPSDVAALVADSSIDGETAAALMAPASRRQGVAASLLELRYSVGKNATAGGDEAASQVAELRGRIADRAAELVRLDGEITALMAVPCGGAED